MKIPTNVVNVVEGARRFVVEWARVREGDRVLVLADDNADAFVVDTVTALARGTGAHVVTCWIEASPIPWKPPGDMVAAAMRHCDKCLCLTLVHHDLATSIARHAYGMTAYFMLPAVPELVGSEAAMFPLEVSEVMGRKVGEMSRTARTIRVTSSRGTDLVARISPDRWAIKPGAWYEPWGEGYEVGNIPGDGACLFPGGGVVCTPLPEGGDGVVVFEHFAGAGPLRQPLRLTFENSWCVEIEGGPEAEAVRQRVKGVENATLLVEIAFGLNPKARIDLEPVVNAVEAERHSGTVHVGMGAVASFASRYPSKSHLDGLMVMPSVFLDELPVMVEGHLLLLDDPDVRSAAARYGYPDDVLRERWDVTPSWVLADR